MEKGLRLRIEPYMYVALYSIDVDKKLSTIVIKFTEDISLFLNDKEYFLTKIKTNSPINYTYVNYDDIDHSSIIISDHTNLIKTLTKTIGISLDFVNKKDFLKFKILFYKGDA